MSNFFIIYVARYVLYGIIFTIFIEFLLSKNHPITNSLRKEWKTEQRIICFLIWPIALIVFLYSFIKFILFKK